MFLRFLIGEAIVQKRRKCRLAGRRYQWTLRRSGCQKQTKFKIECQRSPHRSTTISWKQNTHGEGLDESASLSGESLGRLFMIRSLTSEPKLTGGWQLSLLSSFVCQVASVYFLERLSCSHSSPNGRWRVSRKPTMWLTVNTSRDENRTRSSQPGFCFRLA